jgi:hypothetical protein
MTLRSALAEGGRLDDYQFSTQINTLSNSSTFQRLTRAASRSYASHISKHLAPNGAVLGCVIWQLRFLTWQRI